MNEGMPYVSTIPHDAGQQIGQVQGPVQPDYWPCTFEKIPGESLVFFTAWTKDLLSIIVAVLELGHLAIDYTHYPKDGKLLIVMCSPNYILTGETWQRIIRMHVLKQDPMLVTHLTFESTDIHFLASSPRITYAKRLASLIHDLMQHPEQIRDILKALGKQEILDLIPVRNLPHPEQLGSIGVTRLH